MSLLDDKLAELGVDSTIKNEWDFTPTEEAHVVSHLIRHSFVLSSQMQEYITPDAFCTLECKYIIATWKNWVETNKGFPPVSILSETIAKAFTADDSCGEDILNIVALMPDPNMSVRVQAGIYKWLKHRAYARLFSPETAKAHQEGDYKTIDRLVDEARSVLEADVEPQNLSGQLDLLWNNEQDMEIFPLGIEGFDKSINGGIQRSQLFIWVAPTNKGKTHFMIHNAVSLAFKSKKKVLFITFETAARDCTVRMMSNVTGMKGPLIKAATPAERAKLTKSADKLSENLKILQLEPDKYNADQLDAIIKDHVRQTGFKPDVVILDYLELIVNKRPQKDEGTYGSQKSVSTQLRGLAQSLNVAVITATQTNRDGYMNKANLELSHLAESFGKAMAADYVATINVVDHYADEGRAIGRLFLAKSRHSSNGGMTPFEIDYTTSRVMPFTGSFGDSEQGGTYKKKYPKAGL